MLYQTHIVMNMSAPIGKNILDRNFDCLYPDIKNFLDLSMSEHSLPVTKHKLDAIWLDNGLSNFKLTWNNLDKATEFIKLWQSFNTFALVSADLITVEQDQV